VTGRRRRRRRHTWMTRKAKRKTKRGTRRIGPAVGAGGVLGAAQLAVPTTRVPGAVGERRCWRTASRWRQNFAEDCKDKLLLQAAEKNPFFEEVALASGEVLAMHR
jgi:hypothetical protein